MQGTSISGDLANLLRQYRVAAGLTQEALAERAEVGLRSIQGIERGERLPRRETLRHLIGALALSDAQSRHLEALARRRARSRNVTSLAQNGQGSLTPEAKFERRSHLSVPLTSFIGREREVIAIKRLLGVHRLVTLTGPPGVGKTRLALEIAPRVTEDFPDGVFVIQLAAVRDPDLVLPTMAQAVHIAGYEGQPLVERLVETLKDRRLLFVLDNFEHVETAAPLVAQLLEGCSHIVVMATSRTRLRIRGERELLVPPLAVPAPATLSDPSHGPDAIVSESDAVRLFVDRVRHIQPDLTLDRANVLAIAEICRRLDGLPLAIELAAARCKLISPPVLLKRLSDRFALFGAGPVDLPPRQQTLRAAIAWSHDLLGDVERALFRRLAVFVGGFGLEAVEAVCGGTLDELAVLVDQSLVQAEITNATEGEEPRFRMLETIQEFAREQLAASGEEDLLSAKHATYFRKFAEQSPLATGPFRATFRDRDWNRLVLEHGNVGVALRFLIDRSDAEQVANLAEQLMCFWITGGYDDEARQWVTKILDRLGGAARRPSRARLLEAVARMALKQSDNVLAWQRHLESLAIWRELGDRHAVADGLSLGGLIARWQGQYDEAIRLFEEALAIYQELGDRLGVALSYDRLGLTTFWRGDPACGRTYLEQAVAEHHQTGASVGKFYAIYTLGVVVHGLEDYAPAFSYLDASLAMVRQLGFRVGVSEALASLGDLALDRADLDMARANLAESLLTHRDLGNRREIAHVLECFAGLAALQNHPERAIRLWATAAKLREIIGEPVPPDQKVRLERRVGNLPNVVGEEVFARAWAAGTEMALAAAVAEALKQ